LRQGKSDPIGRIDELSASLQYGLGVLMPYADAGPLPRNLTRPSLASGDVPIAEERLLAAGLVAVKELV
jgi:hypothetical protein